MEKTIIKLKVPAEPKAEFVSHGNLEAVLEPGSVIETEHRRFADWLVAEHGLEELGEETSAPPADEDGDDLGYPEDLPGRSALIAAEVPYATAAMLTAEQLAEYPGIGPKTARSIIEHIANGGTE